MKLSDALSNLQARVREFSEIDLADNQKIWEANVAFANRRITHSVEPILRDARRFAVAINEAVNPGDKEVVCAAEDGRGTIIETKAEHREGFIEGAQDILNSTGAFDSIMRNISSALSKIPPLELPKFQKTKAILQTFNQWMSTIAGNYSQNFAAIITGENPKVVHVKISELPNTSPTAFLAPVSA